jgi:hypothetical protein
VRIISIKLPRALDADAAASVGVIDEHDFPAVGVGLFEGRELAGFRTEQLRRSLETFNGPLVGCVGNRSGPA